MPFKSQAQRRKFAQLLVDGKISPQTYEEWNRETGGKALPERVGRKPKRARKTAAKRRTAAKKIHQTKDGQGSEADALTLIGGASARRALRRASIDGVLDSGRYGDSLLSRDQLDRCAPGFEVDHQTGGGLRVLHAEYEAEVPKDPANLPARTPWSYHVASATFLMPFKSQAPHRKFAPLCLFVLALGGHLHSQAPTSGNPILSGWYADPEAHVFDGEYWIYPTYSAPYDEQTFMDAFSSKDLVTWTKHERVLDAANVRWAKRALWAPSIIEKDGWYYLFFGANDIQNDQQTGGIGVARARNPAGPFADYLGKPLIDRFHNGAQPIDQFVFKDRDGAYYIVYGGWRHCNIARLNDDFTGFTPFADGTIFREITPQGYVEGAFMLVKDGKYYFMWSEGGWTGPNYAVAYAVGSSPFGPFERVGRILQQDPSLATGAGHHSVLQSPASGRWYIVYHRRPLGEKDRNHRVVCIDELRFDADGRIRPVVITNSGVPRDPLR